MTKTKWHFSQKTMTKTKSTFSVKINMAVGKKKYVEGILLKI